MTPPIDPNVPPYGDELTIRVYEPQDHDAVLRLYHDARLGKSKPNDSGADVENIDAGYFGDDGSCFWVAELNGHGVIGTIGVQRQTDHYAQIRRLRVATEHRNRGIGTRLIETSLNFCEEAGYLKVVLDTVPGRAPAIPLFEKFGFQLDTTKSPEEEATMDFYLNLYREREAR